MKVTVAFRDAALRRASIRVELSWLERIGYGTRVRAWNDQIVGTGEDVALTWKSEGTGETIKRSRIVDAIERERTKVAAWRRLAVIARHT